MGYLPYKQYAVALFDEAKATKKLDNVYKDSLMLKGLLKTSEDFKLFINNPVIPVKKKSEILKDMLGSKVDPLTLNFLLLLGIKIRLDLLETIIAYFEDLYFESQNILKAEITTAFDVSEKQAEEICQDLKNNFKHTIEPIWKKNPSIIGGIKIQIKDLIYDYSFKSQLEKFRRTILPTSVSN